MAVLPVYNCFHPVLKKKTEAITEINEDIRRLAKDMFETMYKADGVGLAANQVGVLSSLIVIDVNAGSEEKKFDIPPIVLLNPEIEEFSDDTVFYNEGCLSVPKFYEEVERPAEVTVKYYDLDMKEHKLDADGFLARVVQHEFDHLNGTLFFEKITPLKRALARSKLKKIQRGLIVPDYDMINPDGKMLEAKN